MNILSIPDSINLVGNLTPVRISSEDPVRFRLLEGEVVLLDETYLPDSENLIRINISETLASCLFFDLPSSDCFHQSQLVKTFSLIFNEGQPYRFDVIRAGIRTLSITPELWLKANFLTWQPQEKQVTAHQPEWLTFYAVQSCGFTVKLYFQEEDPFERTLYELQKGKAYTFNLAYRHIASLTEAQPVYYDAYISAGGKRLSYIQRYILSHTPEQAELFVFENSLGGLDTALFTGENIHKPEYIPESALFSDLEVNYSNEKKNLYSQSTGWIGLETSRWLQDLFASTGRYWVQEGNLQPIVLESAEPEISSFEDLRAFNFEYKTADKSVYINTNRDYGELPTSLTILSPDNKLFFLTPRLIEFPEVIFNDNLVLPVQSPFAEKWFRLSLGVLRQELITFVAVSPEAKGPKGDKGEQGIQGLKGEKGDTGAKGATGATGAQGVKGDKGDQGIQGLKGEKGDTGAKGATGATGAQGAKGDKGEQGIQGLKGDKGDTGAKGATGAAGAQGVKGDKGDQGIQGLKGDKGDTGAKGATGATGAQGAKGDKGAQGIQGIKGDKGDQGIQGLKGDKGDAGAKGATGATGAQGVKGDKGAQGIQGLKGDKGDTGAKGATGATGPQGVKGDKGEQGLKGDKGDQGVHGDTIYLRGTGLNRKANSLVIINGICIYNGYERGIRLICVNRLTLNISINEQYDTYISDSIRTNLANRINSLKEDVFVILVSYDAVGWNTTLTNALMQCGSQGNFNTSTSRIPFAFLGYRGLKIGLALEYQSSLDSSAPYAEISTNIINGIFVGIGTQGHKGESGIQGPKGDQGLKGDKGDTGAKGAIGAQGAKGDKGEKGDKGADGNNLLHDHTRISVIDNRGAERQPTFYPERHLSTLFNYEIAGTSLWKSGITVRGWTAGYNSWQLIGPSHNTAEERWYLRSGIATWGALREIWHTGNFNPANYVQTSDSRLTNARPASDVHPWAKAATKPSYTAAEVGAAASNHGHAYLPLTGGKLSNQLIIQTTAAGSYCEGIRINRSTNNWAGILGGVPGSNNGHDGSPWWIGRNPDGVLMLNPTSSGVNQGLDLYKNGEIMWRGKKVWTEINLPVTTAANANQVALRDSSADLHVRLIRTNHPNNNYISGGIMFRVNNSTDNYTRVCDNPAAVVAWLGVSTSVHTHNMITGVYTGSGGHQKPNYFPRGQFRLSMMNGMSAFGMSGAYHDIVVFDSYGGGDVPWTNALAFDRNNEGNVYLLQHKQTDTNWPIAKKLWHSGNFNPQIINLGELTPNYKLSAGYTRFNFFAIVRGTIYVDIVSFPIGIAVTLMLNVLGPLITVKFFSPYGHIPAVGEIVGYGHYVVSIIAFNKDFRINIARYGL